MKLSTIIPAISFAVGLAASPGCATTSADNHKDNRSLERNLTNYCANKCDIARIEAEMEGYRIYVGHCLQKCLDDMGVTQ